MPEIYIAGINGLVGSNLASRAINRGYQVIGKPSGELNFLDRKATFKELKTIRPSCLIIAAAKVGGIQANNENPVQFLSDNLQIQCNLLDAAFAANVETLIFLGSSCIYPKYAEQPIAEEALLSGKLESTNQAYAIAKIAGIELVNSYRKQFGLNWKSVMPCNLYGPRDNFDLISSHVLAALINKIHNSKLLGLRTVTLWGDGTPLREFLYAEDAAEGILTLVEDSGKEPIFNLGSGDEISILDLAKLVSEIIGFEGDISFDTSMPNGTPRKIMQSEKLRSLGWEPAVSLREGIERTYAWYLSEPQIWNGR